MVKAHEINFDGIVGPSHNYAGLSLGNMASVSHALEKSNPKQAALQGLQKMKTLLDMGFMQGVLPPQERPHLDTLRQLGWDFKNPMKVIERAYKEAPNVVVSCFSASSMWTANAATVSPSGDTQDGKVHFTAANLVNKFHRSLEGPQTSQVLQKIFSHEDCFVHHKPLPMHLEFGDEGAANHTRFCTNYGGPGVELFVYGRGPGTAVPKIFPARQTQSASEAIARLHGLDFSKVVLAQQNPEVIDQGVFHNDVIAVGNENVLFFHEAAFIKKQEVLAEIQGKLGKDQAFFAIEVKASEVSVEQTVSSYLFNSQLLTYQAGKHKGEMLLVVPCECEEDPVVWNYIKSLLEGNHPIKHVKVMDVKQSMKNGGGPACLRLRVVLNELELSKTHQGVLLTDDLYLKLVAWVNKNYRDECTELTVLDSHFLEETRSTLDELTQILQLGSIYKFQT